jgi:hypothetical protein
VVRLTHFAYGRWRWRDLQYFARAPYRQRSVNIPFARVNRCTPQTSCGTWQWPDQPCAIRPASVILMRTTSMVACRETVTFYYEHALWNTRYFRYSPSDKLWAVYSACSVQRLVRIGL